MQRHIEMDWWLSNWAFRESNARFPARSHWNVQGRAAQSMDETRMQFLSWSLSSNFHRRPVQRPGTGQWRLYCDWIAWIAPQLSSNGFEIARTKQFFLSLSGDFNFPNVLQLSSQNCLNKWITRSGPLTKLEQTYKMCRKRYERVWKEMLPDKGAG